MSAVGVKIDQFEVPVCKVFQDRIINDQHCYEVDLNKYSNKENIENELKLGFAFFFSYNEDRQVVSNDAEVRKEIVKTSKAGMIRKIVAIDNAIEGDIYLNTIGKYLDVQFNTDNLLINSPKIFRTCKASKRRRLQSQCIERIKSY